MPLDPPITGPADLPPASPPTPPGSFPFADPAMADEEALDLAQAALADVLRWRLIGPPRSREVERALWAVTSVLEDRHNAVHGHSIRPTGNLTASVVAPDEAVT